MKTLHTVLDKALSTKRPHDAKATIRFSEWLADNLPADTHCEFDAIGNLHVDTRISSQNRTLFVAHVDTVHRDRKSTRLNSSHVSESRMPSSA